MRLKSVRTGLCKCKIYSGAQQLHVFARTDGMSLKKVDRDRTDSNHNREKSVLNESETTVLIGVVLCVSLLQFPIESQISFGHLS